MSYLITGYGEPAFLQLLQSVSTSQNLENIPNLSYIEKGSKRINPHVVYRGSRDPLTNPMDYSLIDFQKYSERIERHGSLSSVKVVGSMFTQRGCVYSAERKCTFCSIEEINPRRPKELIKQDMYSLSKLNGADHIRISDADFTANIKHMEQVAKAAEENFDNASHHPSFYVFARADELDERRVSILKKLNATSVFIGYESGSDAMLQSMHKYTTSEQNLNSTKLLKNNGIEVICGGIVLGAQGETESSLEETLQFVQKLKSIENTRSLVATPLIPLPGSPSFRQLMAVLKDKDQTIYQNLSTTDDFDIEELVQIWNKYGSCLDNSSKTVRIDCNDKKNYKTKKS